MAIHHGEPRMHHVAVNGVRLCCFEYGDRAPGAPVALFVHATGFHARCFDATIAHLGLPAIAVDLRGHGRSDRTPPYTWDVFRDDVVALVDALDLRDLVGVGHSMGGHCIALVAAARTARFQRLVLVDPVILAPAVYASGEPVHGVRDPESHPTARRRAAFADAGEMYARFAAREPFSRWRPDVLHDYCAHGLLPAANGAGCLLACPPLVEATIYTGSAGCDPHPLLGHIDVPVTVLRARERAGRRQGAMDFSTSPTWPPLAGSFPRGRDVYLPHLSHFIPMEAPELVADHVAGRC
jgi:pimeloyl-ACP methyl ester carboxylesterase